MLSKEQAAKFIEEKLSIPNWREEIQESRFKFLVKLDNCYNKVMHYETISWGAKSFEELKPPSKEEVLYQCLETGGGACLHLNYFWRLLLEVIGYEAFNVGCETVTDPDDAAHIIVLIRMPKSEPGVISSPDNKTDHVLYMSDAGFARPAPTLLNLDQLPHSYQAGGYTVQHRYNLELQRYERYLIGGNPIRGNFSNPNEEYHEVSFTSIPREFEYCSKCMTSIFNDPDFSAFLNTILLFRHKAIQDCDNFEYVSIRGRSITIGSSSENKITKVETYDDLIPHIEKHFPGLDSAKIKAAINNYKIRQEHYHTVVISQAPS